MFEFPFDVEIWGTVSDWAMVVVTFVTAILLLITLNSQRKVQVAQQRITEIEEKRYLDSIYPGLDIRFYNDLVGLVNDTATINFSFQVKNNAATAKSIQLNQTNKSIKINSLEDEIHIPLLRKGEMFNKTALTSTTECTYISLDSHNSELSDIPQYFFKFDFILTYLDIDGNKYEQEFSYINQNHFAQTLKKPPVSVNS